MKPIKKEGMKVGDVVYIIDKYRKRDRAFIVKIIKLGNRILIDWWVLKEKSKYLFELMVMENYYSRNTQGKYNMTSANWDNYNLFKLNKQEIENFKRNLIIKNL